MVVLQAAFPVCVPAGGRGVVGGGLRLLGPAGELRLLLLAGVQPPAPLLTSPTPAAGAVLPAPGASVVVILPDDRPPVAVTFGSVTVVVVVAVVVGRPVAVPVAVRVTVVAFSAARARAGRAGLPVATVTIAFLPPLAPAVVVIVPAVRVALPVSLAVLGEVGGRASVSVPVLVPFIPAGMLSRLGVTRLWSPVEPVHMHRLNGGSLHLRDRGTVS